MRDKHQGKPGGGQGKGGAGSHSPRGSGAKDNGKGGTSPKGGKGK